MEGVTVSVDKKGDKTDCSNYRDISILSNTYKTLSDLLLSRLTPYAQEIIGDHQGGFRRERSTTDHIYCIRQTHERKYVYKCVYSEAVHQLFTGFRKVYHSVWREVLSVSE